MMKLLRWLAALAFGALLAPSVWAQGISMVRLVPAIVAPGDTNDHVDLAVHRGATKQAATLRVSVIDGAGFPVTKYSSSWATTNPAVASVIAGTVTAKAPGWTTVVLYVSGGMAAQLLVCVSDTGTAAQPVIQQFPAVTMQEGNFDVTHPPALQLNPGELKQFAAVAAADSMQRLLAYDPATTPPGQPWPLPCVHWTSTQPARAAIVGRWGMVRNVTTDTLRPGQFLRARVGPP